MPIMLHNIVPRLRIFCGKETKRVSSVKNSKMVRKLHENGRPSSTLPVEKLSTEDGSSHIAFRRFIPSIAAKEIGVIFFQGLMSNMSGSKAQFLEGYCREKSLNYICFDYQGHGDSSGKFEDFSIGLWKRNALNVLNQLTTGPQVIVGSSIGAWIMLLAALKMPSRIHGMVGIASAPDYLYQRYANLDQVEKSELENQGFFPLASEYSKEPYKIPLKTIQESSNHLLLDKSAIRIDCPVRLIHGMNDSTVPHEISLRLAEKLQSNDVHLHLIKAGDHRLSTPRDLDFLSNVLDNLIFKKSDRD